MKGIARWTAVAALVALGCGDEATTAPAPTTATTGGAGGIDGTGGGATSATTGAGGSGVGGSGGAGGAPVSCPTPALPNGEQQRTITFEGREREYEIQIPLSYDNTEPVPLVFDLHGFTSTKDQQQLVSGMSELAEEEGFVVVRPQGYQSSWNGGDFCCGTAQSEDLDDVGLMKAIVAEVSDELCIDETRVYATGISNGGALSHRIACEAADVFAAVAPVAYPLDFDPFEGCEPSRPIAVMHSHGKNDLVVPYDGSATMPATPDSFAYWANTNGCSGDPVVTYEKGDSFCETYESCDVGVRVTLCTVDGGHVLYTNNDQVPIAELSWSFLRKFKLP